MLFLGEVLDKDGHFLCEHQAAQAENEDVLRNLITSPQHVGFEAGSFGLVFMQEQQRLCRGGSALGVLGRGHGLITGPCCILQQGQEAPTRPPQQTSESYPGQVAEGKVEGATGGE